MKPKIQQNVVFRRHAVTSNRVRRNWNVSKSTSSRLTSQRGSVDHSTITMVFGIVALLIVGGLGFFYLQQVVGTAAEGTDIHALETKIVDLKERQRELELEGAQLRSLNVVEDRVEKLNLVTTDKVTYLAGTDSRVAVAPAQ